MRPGWRRSTRWTAPAGAARERAAPVSAQGALRAVRYEAGAVYRLDVPEGAGPATPASAALPALVALHGYGQDPEAMARYARLVAPAGTVVIAPQGPLSWYVAPDGPGGASAAGVGYGWVADPCRDESDRRNAALLHAVWADAAATLPLDPRRSVVLGFSQGVGVAVAWLLSGAPLRGGLVALAGGVRVPLRPRLAELARLPALWVTGERDRAYPPAYMQALLPVLREAGLALEHVELPAGHALAVPAAGSVRAWLAARERPALPDPRAHGDPR